jgi:hypothetical protein
MKSALILFIIHHRMKRKKVSSKRYLVKRKLMGPKMILMI